MNAQEVLSSVESALERHGISNPRLDIAEGDSVHTVMYYPEKDMDRDTASALSEELSSDMGRMVRVVRSGWGIVFEIPKDKALRRERLFDDEIEKTDFDERMCLPLSLVTTPAAIRSSWILSRLRTSLYQEQSVRVKELCRRP